jgi:hypothetical protein
VLFFIFKDSNNKGIAVISFDLLSTCSSPSTKPDLALVFGTVKIIKLKGKQNAKANKIYSGI